MNISIAPHVIRQQERIKKITEVFLKNPTGFWCSRPLIAEAIREAEITKQTDAEFIFAEVTARNHDLWLSHYRALCLGGWIASYFRAKATDTAKDMPIICQPQTAATETPSFAAI